MSTYVYSGMDRETVCRVATSNMMNEGLDLIPTIAAQGDITGVRDAILAEVAAMLSGSGADPANVTSLTYTLWVRSVTPFATPAAFAATESRQFASTTLGAATMGFGTTNDVTFLNRAGTTVFGITANTTTVAFAGAITTAAGLTAATALTVGATGTNVISSFLTAGNTAINTGTALSIQATGTTNWGSIRFTDNSTANAYIGFITGSSAATRFLGFSNNSSAPQLTIDGNGAVVMTGTLDVTGLITATAGITTGASADVNSGRSITLANAGRLGTVSFGKIMFPSDGVFTLYNNAETNFSILQFGGTTNAFPALVRVSTALECKFADNSAYTVFRAGAIVSDANVTISGGIGLGGATTPSNGIAFGTAAPGALANGQIWYDGTNLKARLSGATVTIVVV